ncbi:MAG: hypothetical protein K2M36_01330 [Clostridia bacterium]|nr:hypothetical protein [Clostridia bacterium]
MDKCRACGSENLIYKSEKKCLVCLDCGARFTVSEEEAKQIGKKQPQSGGGVTTNNQQNNSPKVQKVDSFGKQQQLKYFAVYKKLPNILMVITIVAAALIGIAPACLLRDGAGIGVWFGCAIGGAIVGLIERWILKVAISPSILQIYYLQKLNGEKITAFDE